MLYVEITIKDELGTVVVPVQRGPANQPILWKTLPGTPVVIDRPGNENGVENGAYLLWHYAWQPGITLDLQHKRIKPPNP